MFNTAEQAGESELELWWIDNWRWPCKDLGLDKLHLVSYKKKGSTGVAISPEEAKAKTFGWPFLAGGGAEEEERSRCGKQGSFSGKQGLSSVTIQPHGRLGAVLKSVGAGRPSESSSQFQIRSEDQN